MTNVIVLIGKITEITTEENNKKVIIKLAIKSPTNFYGEYKTDFVKCQLHKGIMDSTLEYCSRGDTVAIKGKIATEENNTIVIAEKLTFLKTSYRKFNDEE